MGGLPYRKTCPDYPVDASALELLLSQAKAARARQQPQHAATLLGRARRHALESPDLTEAICNHPSGEQLGCAEAGRRD